MIHSKRELSIQYNAFVINDRIHESHYQKNLIQGLL